MRGATDGKRWAGALALAVACGAAADPVGFGGGGQRADGSSSGDDGGGGSGDGGGDGSDTGVPDSGAGGDGGSGDDTGGPPEIVGTGYSRGDTAYDIEAENQSGSPWSLHDRLGLRVVLLFGDADDADTVAMLGYLGSVDRGVSELEVAFIAGQDEDGAAADEADAARWATTYGITTVLTDTGALRSAWAGGSAPYLVLIDREMAIAWTNAGFTPESQLRGEIGDLD